MRKPFLLLLTLMLTVPAAYADSLNLTVDPGPVGSSFTLKDFDSKVLAGTALAGQTLSIDITFGGKFIVGKDATVGFALNQSGALGTFPASGYFLSGYMVDALGKKIENGAFVKSGTLPSQIWPGWPFTLPDGSPWLPATTIFELTAKGTPTGTAPDSPIIPVIFYGLHLDITLPTSSEMLIGSRLTLSNFQPPLLVSPEEIPSFHVPETSSWMLVVAGLIVGIPIVKVKWGSSLLGADSRPLPHIPIFDQSKELI